MAYIPCRERVFPLRLAPEFVRCYETYAHWLKHLLERLGREPARRLWRNAFPNREEEWLVAILSTGWQAEAGEIDVEARIDAILAGLFPAPIEAVSREEARQIILQIYGRGS